MWLCELITPADAIYHSCNSFQDLIFKPRFLFLLYTLLYLSGHAGRNTRMKPASIQVAFETTFILEDFFAVRAGWGRAGLLLVLLEPLGS
jgi:hypothetical protein